MSTRRQLRVAELLQRELAQMVTFELRDPRLALVTITRARVSPDLRYANIYFTTLGDQTETAEAVEALTSATSYMRRELGKRTDLRYVPDLSFHLDEGLVESRRINELLDALVIDDDDDAALAEDNDQDSTVDEE